MQFPSALPSAAFSASFPLVNTDKIAAGLENRKTKTLPFPPVVQTPSIIESKNRNLPQNPLPYSPPSRPAIQADKGSIAAEVRINEGQSIDEILTGGEDVEDDLEDFIPPKVEVPEVPIRENPDKQQQEALQQIQNQQLIRELKVRDREVRSHEAAHAAAGAELAGVPSYSYQKGPDGRNYAIGGEVAINTSSVEGNPEATLERSNKIRRAALAPVNPSAQDMHIATMASRMGIEARAEIQAIKSRERLEETEASQAKTGEAKFSEDEGSLEAFPTSGVSDTNEAGDSSSSSSTAGQQTLSSSPVQRQGDAGAGANDAGINQYRSTASNTQPTSLGSYIEQSI